MAEIDEEIREAVATYRRLFPEPIMLEDPGDWLADGLRWLKDFGVPLICKLVENPRFQHTASKLIRNLAPNAKSAERRAIEGIQRRQSGVAEEIRRLADIADYKTRLNVQLCTFGTPEGDNGCREGTPVVQLTPRWTETRLDALIEELQSDVVRLDDYFRGGDVSKGVVANPLQSPYVSPLVRGLVDRVDRRHDELHELLMALEAIDPEGPNTDEISDEFEELKPAWSSERAAYKALHDALGVGERRRSSDAHSTAVLLFAAFCGQEVDDDDILPRVHVDVVEKLAWLGLDEKVVREGATWSRIRLSKKLGYELERLRTQLPLLTELPSDEYVARARAEEATIAVYGMKGPVRFQGEAVKLSGKPLEVLCWLAVRMNDHRGTKEVGHEDFSAWSGSKTRKGALKATISRLKEKLRESDATKSLADKIPEAVPGRGYRLDIDVSEISISQFESEA